MSDAEANGKEWLSLQDAARLVGVHPATLRLWSDRGRIPSRRTPGGHRRFRREDLQAWLDSQHRREPEAELLVQNALGRVRMKMDREGMNNAPWFASYNEALRQRHREMGRQLLGLLLRFLSSPDQRPAAVQQACEIGQQYAIAARQNGLSLPAAVQAVLFFRDSLTDSVVQMAASMGSSDGVDWASTHRQVTTFINQVLLSMIEAYMAQGEAKREPIVE